MATENTQEDLSKSQEVISAAKQLVDEALGILDEKFPDELAKTDPNEDPDGNEMTEVDTTDGEPTEKSEEEKKEEKDPKDEKKDEESDEEVQKSFDAACAKMKARGLNKSEATAPTTEVRQDTKPFEDLQKSVDARFADLTKMIESVATTVQKIAKQPTGRRSVSGVQPLKKNAEDTLGADESQTKAPTMPKSEAMERLLKAQIDGDTRVTPVLIGKFESGRGVTPKEIQLIKSVVGLN